MTSKSISISAAAANDAELACQACKKRKVKAKITAPDGKVWLLCKACTLERTTLTKGFFSFVVFQFSIFVILIFLDCSLFVYVIF